MNPCQVNQVLNKIDRDGLYSLCKDGYKMWIKFLTHIHADDICI